MKSYIISYDLVREPNSEDYKKLFDKIKAQGNALRVLKSVWMRESDQTSTEIMTSLKSVPDQNDKAMVMKMGHGNILNFSETELKWINAHVTD
ncbi:MAG: hypothetical protein JWR15_3469 [Prosthecobacter sp.]|nr:hypothetical protein [Prosthecobacter sp.]